jgi:kinesin family protein 5
VLSPSLSQDDMYDKGAKDVVCEVLSGYNGTIMAYGQTGSGKTHTVFGSRKSLDYVRELHPKSGIIPRAIDYIFSYIHQHIDDV